MATNQNTDFVYTQLSQTPSDATSFPAIGEGGAGMQQISIPPGSMLTPHWHPNSNETTYCLGGTGVVGLVIPTPTSAEPIGATFQRYQFSAGDVVFLPQGYAHFFANGSSTDDLVLLLTFDNPNFDILTLADVLQQLPQNITAAAEASVPNAGSSPVIPYTM